MVNWVLGYRGHTELNEFLLENGPSVFPNQGNAVIARFNYFVDSANSKAFTFDASSSHVQGASVMYTWAFGDGSPLSFGKIITHTFSDVGTYSVQLTVTNSLGQMEEITRDIIIEPDGSRPILPIQQEFSVTEGKTIAINLKSALDFDDTSLTYSIVDDPQEGTLSNCALNNGGDFTCKYEAPSGFTGVTQFSYQASDGTLNSNLAVVKLNIVPSHPSVLEVVIGESHTCALYENKKVRCWGYNSYGQLGLGHTNNIGDDEIPINVGFVDVGANVIGLSLGENHTCALLENKSVKCWGQNWYGQLGLGNRETIGDDELPSSIGTVSLGENAKKVISGGGFSCALLESGLIKCWGQNDSGQLGLGNRETIGSQSGDVLNSIKLGGRAIDLFTGGHHSCALLKEGRIRCWGYNRYGQLGLGHTYNIGDDEHPFIAGDIDVGQKVKDMVLGLNHTCVLLEDKSVKCWGQNDSGQLGLGHRNIIGDDELPSSLTPINFDVDVKKIIAGNYFTCSLLVNNEIKCWGSQIPRLGFNSQSVEDIIDIDSFF